MARKIRCKKGAKIYAQRKAIVEPVNGQIKEARGLRRFLLRGILITQLAPRRPPRPYRVVHKYQFGHGAQRHPVSERPLAA